MDKTKTEDKPKYRTVNFNFNYSNGRVIEYEGWIDPFRGIVEGKFKGNSGEE